MAGIKHEFIVGHFGDALNAIIPLAISTLDITSDYIGLLPSNNADNSTLSHLKSSGPEVTKPIQVDGQDNVTFLQDANLTIPDNTNLIPVAYQSLSPLHMDMG